VAASSVGVTAVSVVAGFVAVQGDPDGDAELVEEVAVAFAQQQAVGLDAESQLADAGQCGA
jgi:hypothetical protein